MSSTYVTCKNGRRVEVPDVMSDFIARLLLLDFSQPELANAHVCMLTMHNPDKSTLVNLLYNQHTVDVLHYHGAPRGLNPDACHTFTDLERAWEVLCRWM